MAAIEPGASDALIVIDVQNDFCPGGALAVAGANGVVAPINRLMDRFATVIGTQDWHPPGHLSFASRHSGHQPFESVTVAHGEQTLWPDHCVQGTAGADFHPNLDADRFELIVRKGFRPEIDSYSAFFENDRTTPTGLSGYLRARGLARLFLCGLAGDVCVHYSALDAQAEGFEILFIADATADVDLDGSAAAARADRAAKDIRTIQTSDIVG